MIQYDKKRIQPKPVQGVKKVNPPEQKVPMGQKGAVGQKAPGQEIDVFPETPYGPFLLKIMSAGPIGFCVALASVSAAAENEEKQARQKQNQPPLQSPQKQPKQPENQTKAQKVLHAGLMADEAVILAKVLARAALQRM